MSATVGASLGSPINSSPASDTRRAFYESHKPVAVLMILIIFSFPILGVFIRGVSGLLIGVAEVMTAQYISGSLRDALTFGLLLGFLVLRPRGLFGKSTMTVRA